MYVRTYLQKIPKKTRKTPANNVGIYKQITNKKHKTSITPIHTPLQNAHNTYKIPTNARNSYKQNVRIYAKKHAIPR